MPHFRERSLCCKVSGNLMIYAQRQIATLKSGTVQRSSILIRDGCLQRSLFPIFTLRSRAQTKVDE
jgi:hypothetical protein